MKPLVLHDVEWLGVETERGNVVHGLCEKAPGELVEFESCADELEMDDGQTWGEFLREQQIPKAERVQRCAKCWKGAGCECAQRQSA